MFSPKTTAIGFGAALLCGAIAAMPAQAQFYKGKTLNVIINYGAGGNTDIQGRSVLRFMGKYIPGNPRIVVKNLPGAGGVVGTNYLGEAARNNGTVMGIFTFAFSAEIMDDPALRVSHKDFIMVGAIGQQQIAHVRRDVVDGGIKQPFDFLKVKKVFKSAGHSPTSSKDISIKVTLQMLGIKHQHVTGYKSASPIRRALLQNDVQYSEDSLTGFYSRVHPILVKPGHSIPLWHVGVPTPDGGLKAAATVDKNIPTFLDMYKAKHGKDAMPSGLPWKTYLKFAQSRQALRILLLPPGTPKDAVAALRAAWAKTTKDSGYLAEYRKQNNSDLVPQIGEDAQKVMNRILTVTPDVKAYLKKVSDQIAASS